MIIYIVSIEQNKEEDLVFIEKFIKQKNFFIEKNVWHALFFLSFSSYTLHTLSICVYNDFYREAKTQHKTAGEHLI